MRLQRKDEKSWKEFFELKEKASKIAKQDNVRDVDMMAGFYTGIVLEKAKNKVIDKQQKSALLNIIECLQICRYDFLVHKKDKKIRFAMNRNADGRIDIAPECKRMQVDFKLGETNVIHRENGDLMLVPEKTKKELNHKAGAK